MAVPKSKKHPPDEPDDKGPEAPDDSEFDQAAKGEAAGLGRGPGEGAKEETELKTLVGPMPEEKPTIEPPPEVTIDDQVNVGLLYACDRGKVSFIKNGHLEGEKIDHHAACVVEMNGKPATLDDLRRGDLVSCFGLPVKKIVANR